MEDGYQDAGKVLSNEMCLSYVGRLFSAMSQDKTSHDPQCPSSPSMYGLFDDLLLDLKPTIEKVTNKSLLPTYSYTRLYLPGEILRIHTDRHACEISVTLTLGYCGNDAWPIYFIGKDEKDLRNESGFHIDVGHAVVYKGCLPHWRDHFRGLWQAQVFLHYVDANGPYTEWVYDKREGLNIHAAK